METMTWQMGVLALCGMILHISMKIKPNLSNDNKFSFKKYFQNKMNVIRLAISLIATFSLLLMLKEVSSMLDVELSESGSLMNVLSFSAGYFNDSLIRNLIKFFKPKISAEAPAEKK